MKREKKTGTSLRAASRKIFLLRISAEGEF